MNALNAFSERNNADIYKILSRYVDNVCIIIIIIIIIMIVIIIIVNSNNDNDNNYNVNPKFSVL